MVPESSFVEAKLVYCLSFLLQAWIHLNFAEDMLYNSLLSSHWDYQLYLSQVQLDITTVTRGGLNGASRIRGHKTRQSAS